jgi:taurine dioxygenase
MKEAVFTAQGAKIVPSGGGLGAEIRGLDLRDVSASAFAMIHRAWLDNLVLLFRGQNLTPDALIAFSRRFGELDLAPVQETGRRFVEGMPELYIVSNVLKDGTPIGSLGSGEASWHTDMSYLEQPPMASMLYAIEIPASGGNTQFINMYSFYEVLPDELKRKIGKLRIKHDATYNSGGYLRQGTQAVDDPRASPGTYHPLVCSHPETGRAALYLGRRRNAYIEGLSLAESEALLDELWSYAARAELTWENIWSVGDVVLWDNRCTMHRRDAFDPGTRRILYRTQIRGTARPAPQLPFRRVRWRRTAFPG